MKKYRIILKLEYMKFRLIPLETWALPFLAIGLSKSGFHEILRHSLPTALHETEEFLLSYLIYKVFRWIS